MVRFTVEEIQKIMYSPDNIRNLSVIAHVDHGKSTLTDSLIARAGIIAKETAGENCYMDGRTDEKERGITIKSTGVSLFFDYKNKDYLFNLIDSPGHVDFSSEVTAALRVTDGALVVVDCIEGVCVQTGTVLKQSMQERIKPVLVINKVDRAILELQLDGEAIYQNFTRVIQEVDIIVKSYAHKDLGDIEMHPTIGNVAFGSGKACWGFTLKTFADILSKKFGVDEEKMINKLWGDNFFDKDKKVWTTKSVNKDGVKLKRAFVSFILDPIITISKACIEDNEELIDKLLLRLNVKLNSKEREEKGKDLLKIILSKWINVSNAILEMMVVHLPSPKTAQKYRYKYLYKGPADDDCARAIQNCDSKGPLMMYVSKMIPTTNKGRFYAFGRVFSGELRTGSKIRIMGPEYQPGKKAHLVEKQVQRVVLMMGRTTDTVSNVPCGNTCAIMGIDDYLTKTGTITNHPDAYGIRDMKYSVSPVVRVAVKPKNIKDMPKLIEGMRKLAKSDPLVQCILDDETGENIIAGAGELHVEICINDLCSEFAQVELVRSDPVVAYRETVTALSKDGMCKSANNHNRIYCNAEPIEEELSRLIEEGDMPTDLKERTKLLSTDFNWDKSDANRIWAFGPDGEGANTIVDTTQGCQFMSEIKEHAITGFEMATKSGILCGEPLRGVRFNITDTKLHNDSIHRGGGQLVPTTRRVLAGAELSARPTLQEPVFLVEISSPAEVTNIIYEAVSLRRGNVIEENWVEGSRAVSFKVHLPVSESFGFSEMLQRKTGGKAFASCAFDHWRVIEGDVFNESSMLAEIVGKIRKRKGLKGNMPDASHYLDKL